MDPLAFSYKNHFKILTTLSSMVLLKKTPNSNFIIIIIVAQLIFVLKFGLHQTQKPSIHHHHATIQNFTHRIRFHHIFMGKEKQLQAIQKILPLRHAQISIILVIILRNSNPLSNSK
jgi:hypothetical protein